MLGIVGLVSQGEEKMFTLMSEQIFTPMKMTIYSVLNKVTKISSFFAYLSCAVHQWSSSPVAFQAAHHEHFEISHMLSVRWNLQPWSFNRWNYCFLRRLEMRQTARNEKRTRRWRELKPISLMRAHIWFRSITMSILCSVRRRLLALRAKLIPRECQLCLP